MAFLLPYLPRTLAAGVTLALGLESATLWLRYIGVPIVQSDAVSSPALGGFPSLAGAVMALGVGLRLARVPAQRLPIPSLEAPPT